MNKNYTKIIIRSVLISIIGVLVIDYFSHLLFSNPMEPLPYFMAKTSLYFVFSILFLSLLNLKEKELLKIFIGGVVVSLMWGIYYNILPVIFNFSPFGIPVIGLTFLGMGLLGTGLAFGIVHTLAFMGGYYSVKYFFTSEAVV